MSNESDESDAIVEGVPLPHGVPPPVNAATPAEVAQLAGLLSGMGFAPPVGGGNSLRRKLFVGLAIAALGAGASIMSCVGQSFAYRQARALEGIEQQLRELRADFAHTRVNVPRVP